MSMADDLRRRIVNGITILAGVLLLPLSCVEGRDDVSGLEPEQDAAAEPDALVLIPLTDAGPVIGGGKGKHDAAVTTDAAPVVADAAASDAAGDAALYDAAPVVADAAASDAAGDAALYDAAPVVADAAASDAAATQDAVPECDPPVQTGESGNHNPGTVCTICHVAGGIAPPWTISGTIYTAASGGNALPGATIHILDALASEIVLVSAQNGNFYTDETVVFPVTVLASRCPDTAEMNAAVASSASCNTCHNSSFRIPLP